jgi:uncharacterized protein
MQYRRFGRTELSIPVFSCGGMRYQYKWQDMPMQEIPASSQANLEATIQQALEVGINHIETARGYGTSELQLGEILPTLPRDKLIVQTKVGVNEANQFQRNLEQSFDNLKLNYIDLLGLHGINSAQSLDQCTQTGGCLDIARKFKQQGRIRHIGFSTHAPTDVILKAIATDQFDYVNLHWYYINQGNWAAIEAAKRHDMGVFIISPSNKGGNLYNPPQKLVDLCYPLSPMVFNDLFCLSHPEVHTLSIGASRPQDIEEHLKTLALLDRADEILPPIIERLEQTAIAELGENWFRTWHVGLPEHYETPGGVNIPVILWLRNLAIAYGMIDYGKMRYNLLTNAGDWFPGAKADQISKLDLRACLAHSPHGDRIPALLAEAHELLAGTEVKRLSQQ